MDTPSGHSSGSVELSKIDNSDPADVQDYLLNMLRRLNEEHQIQIEPIGVKML